MRAEPRTRTRCAQCRGLKTLTSPAACQIPNHKALLRANAFCSRKCAEKFHGTEWPKVPLAS